MNRAKCLICDKDIPWWQKLGSNNRVGIECRNCHSIMKHSSNIVWLSLGLVLVSAICIGHYEFDFSSILFLAGWAVFVSLAIVIMGRAKLELVYENEHRAKST